MIVVRFFWAPVLFIRLYLIIVIVNITAACLHLTGTLRHSKWKPAGFGSIGFCGAGRDGRLRSIHRRCFVVSFLER